MRKEINRVIKDSSIYGLGSLIPRAAAIVLTPIYTTYLSRSDYGVMSFVAMLSSMVGTLMLLGQQGSLIYYYRGTAIHAEERRELLFTVFWFVMLFGGLLLGLGYLFGPSSAAKLTGSHEITFYPFLSIGLLTAFFGLPQAIQQAINRAQGQAKLFTAFAVSFFAINTGFTLYFVVSLHQGAYGSLKGTFVATVIIAPIALYVIIRRWTPRVRIQSLKRSLRYGLPLVPHYFAGWALTFIDRFLLLRLSTTAQVGLYSLAYNFSMVLNVFCTAINQAWAPIYFDLADTEEGRKSLPRLTTVYAAAVTVLAIGYTLLAPDLLLLLANRRFHAAAPVVPVVAGGYFFFALYMVVSTPIFHSRKTGWAPIISGSAAVLNVLANLYLIPRYGMLGAAWATLIAYLFMALVARSVSNRLRRGVYEDRKLLVLVGIYLVSMAIAIVFIKLGLNVWVDLAIKAAIVPAVLSLLVVFRVATMAELRAFVRRRPAPAHKSTTMEEEAAQQALRAGEIGNTTDDTGTLPDDTRPWRT